MRAVVYLVSIGFILVVLFGLVKGVQRRYAQLDRIYGKPYKARVVQIVRGHPDLKPGKAAMTFHPTAILLRRKAFPFSQILSIRINTEPDEGSVAKPGQYISILVQDEKGEHEIILTAVSGFDDLSRDLMGAWRGYLI